MIQTAALIVKRVAIRNFRCIKNLEVELEAGTTVLVGENNVGKSSILLALSVALGHRRAITDDLRRDANGSIAPTAEIDILLGPPTPQQKFGDEIAQRLIAVQRDPSDGREVVGIRLALRGSGEGGFLLEARCFLQPSKDAWVESPTPAFSGRVLDLVDAHLMDASRDLMAEMANKNSAWGRVLSDLKIPDLPDLAEEQLNPLGQRGLERDLTEISRRVRQASPVLSQLHSDLGSMKAAQSSVGDVDLVPLPLRLEELARTMEIVLHQDQATGLPLRFHGAGSRSLAALLVFRTMCTLKIGADQAMKPHLITLLEEPEAHLHPHAVASLNSVFDSIPGQRVVSSHSPTLVAEMSPSSIRLLQRSAGDIRVKQLGPKRPRNLEQFRRFFGRPFAEVFFARLVVFGDGVTERNALPTLIAMSLGADAAAFGVSCVDCKSMSRSDEINPVLDALSDLEIPWVCFADNDPAGVDAINKLRDPIDDQPLSVNHPNVVVLTGTKQIEQLLIDAGYGEEISAVAGEVGIEAQDDKARLAFLSSQKGWAAEAVVKRAKAAAKPAPAQLEPLFEKVRSRLGIAADTSAAVVS